MNSGKPPFDLVAFDVDGTLVRSPDGRNVWQLLNGKIIGNSRINEERYRRFLAGELSYADWVDLDIGGWREADARRPDLVAGFEALRLIDGARDTLNALRDAGCRLFVISGTLDLMLNTLWPDHPFEEIYTNHIGFDDEGRIAHWRATPFDMDGKAKLLRALAMRESIPLARCAYVGDSSNDVWIARTAGRTIALNPNCEELESLAGAVVRSDDLRAILPHLLEA